MRSVRLDDHLEDRLREAASITGEPVSEIIRQGVADRCDAILRRSAFEQLEPFIGSVPAGPRRRNATHEDELRLSGFGTKPAVRSRKPARSRPRRRSRS